MYVNEVLGLGLVWEEKIGWRKYDVWKEDRARGSPFRGKGPRRKKNRKIFPFKFIELVKSEIRFIRKNIITYIIHFRFLEPEIQEGISLLLIPVPDMPSSVCIIIGMGDMRYRYRHLSIPSLPNHFSYLHTKFRKGSTRGLRDRAKGRKEKETGRTRVQSIPPNSNIKNPPFPLSFLPQFCSGRASINSLV